MSIYDCCEIQQECITREELREELYVADVCCLIVMASEAKCSIDNE